MYRTLESNLLSPYSAFLPILCLSTLFVKAFHEPANVPLTQTQASSHSTVKFPACVLMLTRWQLLYTGKRPVHIKVIIVLDLSLVFNFVSF